ncbi:MAG: alpha-amylase family glycosyl hydrolase [Promethearchaeota archaeon]
MHQKMYEINSRAWLHELNERFKDKMTLLKIPDEIWGDICDKFDWIWLMGVWEVSPIEEGLFDRHPGLMYEINEALPGWRAEDVIGSPYSIVQYKFNPILGEPGDLAKLHKKLNQMGSKLMLDFVPNHFGKASPLARNHPQYFIHSVTAPMQKPELFEAIETEEYGTHWIAYGKDPFFPPWDDTFQLNYTNPDTREHMQEILYKIASVCDGVRCDMAMLCLNEVIKKTWGWFLKNQDFNRPQKEFWKVTIHEIKNHFPNFVFLAEVYWDLQYRLQQLGFDFTYDKRLYDRLKFDPPNVVRSHLLADLDFQKKSLRYIENHDEQRAITAFEGRERSLAAAIIVSTLPGMCLFHHGQLEGKTIKLPVQLRQTKTEPVDKEVQLGYERVLQFINQEVFQKGAWALLECSQAWEGNNSWRNLLAYQWTLEERELLSVIVVNYSSTRSQGRVHIKLPNYINGEDFLILNDKMAIESYQREQKTIQKQGLYVDLQPFQAHLFNLEKQDS